MKRRIFVSAIAASIATTAVSILPAAANEFPNKVIRIIVPSAPGGLIDPLARLIGDAYEKAWGQPVILDHKPGAGAMNGTDLAAKSTPDGYTLVISAVGPLSVNPSLYAKMPYDVAKDFTPIALVASFQNVLILDPKVPANSVAEFTRLARDSPGKINYASSGAGSTQHLSGEMYNALAGIKLTHVPYKGTMPALSDLIAGHVQGMFINIPAAIPYIESGKVKALAVTGDTRSASLPQVPTMKEAGFPSYSVTSWVALVGPAGIPAPIVTRLNAEAVQTLKSPEGQKLLKAQDAEIGGGSPEQLKEFMATERVKWAKLIREANIKLE